MKIKKFLDKVKDFLKLDNFQKSNKKKSVENFVKKLKIKKKQLSKAIKKELLKKKRKDIQEELDIVFLQIKKGKAILKKLNS